MSEPPQTVTGNNFGNRGNQGNQNNNNRSHGNQNPRNDQNHAAASTAQRSDQPRPMTTPGHVNFLALDVAANLHGIDENITTEPRIYMAQQGHGCQVCNSPTHRWRDCTDPRRQLPCENCYQLHPNGNCRIARDAVCDICRNLMTTGIPGLRLNLSHRTEECLYNNINIPRINSWTRWTRELVTGRIPGFPRFIEEYQNDGFVPGHRIPIDHAVIA